MEFARSSRTDVDMGSVQFSSVQFGWLVGWLYARHGQSGYEMGWDGILDCLLYIGDVVYLIVSNYHTVCTITQQIPCPFTAFVLTAMKNPWRQDSLDHIGRKQSHDDPTF